MSRSRSERARSRALTRWRLVGFVVLAGACIESGEYRYGENVTGLRFEIFDEDEGIHPADVTLTNPRNPFRDHPIGEETKFLLLAQGGNAAGFYAWATLLARAPSGENQFYTATKLHDVAVSGELSSAEEVCRVTRMAGRAYQAVLDFFPDSVSYLEDGTPFYLAPLAYRGIEDLGLRVRGDWVLATDAGGNEVAVRIAGRDTPRPEIEQEVDPCAP